jgi:hypothetical protein
VRQLLDATVELLEAVFSVRSVPRCYKQDKSRVNQLESVRRVGGWCEMAVSMGVVRQSPPGKDVNTEVEGSTALEAGTRQRLVKTQQSEKT